MFGLSKKKQVNVSQEVKKVDKRRKTLVKDFEQLIQEGDIEKLKNVFQNCQWDAYDLFTQNNALIYANIPDEFVIWLVKQGAHINYVGRWEKTPLHYKAQQYKSSIPLYLQLGADIEARDYEKQTPLFYATEFLKLDNVIALVEAGAKINCKDVNGKTPLEAMLERNRGSDLRYVYPIAEYLLNHGAKITQKSKELVTKIGKDFEFYRKDISKYDKNVQPIMIESDRALQQLYNLFHVEPVPKRNIHDGKKDIIVQSVTWQKQHQELWELLVPSVGAAQTVQGEVIRISGKVSYEILDNGGMNWDKQYRMMLKCMGEYLRKGHLLEKTLYKELDEILKQLSTGRNERGVDRLCELSVLWVLINPQPILLESVEYKR